MKKNNMIVIVVAMLCLMSLGIAFCFLGLNNSIEKKCLEYVENSVETVDKPVENVCEHDWVVTSEYSWLRSQYRNVSKCSKCGEVVK